MALSGYPLLGVVFFFVFIIYGTFSSVWFFKRRHLYPIKARMPQFCLLHQMSYWVEVLSLSYWLVNGHEGPCRWYHWLQYFVDIVAALPYGIRLFQLYFRYKITTEIMSHRETAINPSEAPKIGWYTQRQRWISSEHLTKVFLVLMPSFIPLCAIFSAVYTQVTKDLLIIDPQCPPLFSHKNLLFVIMAVSSLPVCICVFSRVREIEEGLFIKNELMWTAIMGFTCVILCYVPQINTRYEVECTLVIIAMFLFNTTTYVYPTYLTYRYGEYHITKRPRLNSTSMSSNPSQTYLYENIPRLHVYLQQPAQFMAFWKFLAKEFAVESLLFWRDLQTLKKFIKKNETDIESALPGHVQTVHLTEDGSCLPSSNVKVYQMIQLILKMYITEGAPQSINISFENRENIIEMCRNLSPQSAITETDVDDIFKRTVKDVFAMLECDSYIRFAKSEFYVTQTEGEELSPIDTSMAASLAPTPHSPVEHELSGTPNPEQETLLNAGSAFSVFEEKDRAMCSSPSLDMIPSGEPSPAKESV